MTTTINRDPFARTELVRERAYRKGECGWCGQPARFLYGTLHNGINTVPHWHPKMFCSVGCYRAYVS